MSALAGVDGGSRAPGREDARPTATSGAWARPSPALADASPTTTVWRMLLAVCIALLLGLLLNARHIVRDTAEMQDGPIRSLLLAVGQPALQLAEATHLVWPRDQLDAVLGRAPQPTVPPLLAGVPLDPSPIPPATPTSAPRPTSTAVRLRVLIPPTVLHPAPSPTPALPTRTPPASTPTPHRAPRHGGQASIVASPARSPAMPHARVALPSPTPARAPTAQRTSTRIPLRSTARAHTPSSPGMRGAHPRSRSSRPRPRSHSAAPSPRLPARRRAQGVAGPTYRLRRPTAGHPLRLLVTGDSLTGYLGPILIDKTAAVAPIVGFVDTHNGTGLTRPDFVDWSLVAQQQVAADNPDVTVVMMGGNDFQNMTLPDGRFFTAGTPAWTREYQRRAAICMRIWTRGGTRRVYWLSMPPARDPTWAYDDGQINVALRRAAALVPGATYLDVLGPVTDHGRYTDFVPDGHGQPTLIREPDGVHLNETGSAIVADEVLHVFEQQWRR